MSSFSERLKELRIKNGVSQQELADFLKINKQTISGYERGVRRPAGENASEIYEKIADYFNVDVSYLLGYSDYTIRLETPSTNLEILPSRLANKYAKLTLEGKENVHNAIEAEYEKQQTRLSEFKKVMKLDKITTLDEAKAIMGNAAAFGGYASDEQLIRMANAVLQTEKKKEKKKK